MILPRRSFLTGLVSALAAPAIVRVENIMPVRAIVMPAWLPRVRWIDVGSYDGIGAYRIQWWDDQFFTEYLSLHDIINCDVSDANWPSTSPAPFGLCRELS